MICIKVGCSRSAHAKKLCSKHYSQAVRAGRIKQSWRQINKRSQYIVHARNGAYKSWQHMKARCYDRNHPSYKYYGARGIKVCERWLSSFANFLADMGPRPAGLTIDRINGRGNYEPGNCRWADWRMQAANRRKNKLAY
jgi:hypothetical protein